MSNGDFVDDADEVRLGELRFQQTLADLQERNMLLRAIHVATGIEQEVAGETPGFILHYLKDMQTQAIEAVAVLIGRVSMSESERLEAKLKVEPYANLMHWLRGKSATTRSLNVNLEELEKLISGTHPDDEE